jgi:competence/damage-inducible protein CinA-like protein
MKACIVAVGSELLTPFRVDTNSLFITERLNTVGFDVRLKTVVGDNIEELSALLQQVLAWADLLVLTGGLGPTADDITRDAVARVLALPFDEDEATVARIRERFARRGMVMQEINRRQAMVPKGAVLLDNPNGTAPGLWLGHEKTAIVLLPGPPREMRPMFEAVVRDRLAVMSGGAGLFRRVLKITGRPESEVDARAEPIYGPWTKREVPISTTILAVLGQIELHLTTRAASSEAADRVLDPAVRELQRALGDDVYSVDGSGLEEVVGRALRTRALKIAVAESCTGGLLTSRLTDVPGSSAYVERSEVCYSNQAKIDSLGVPAALIDQHGAVSEPVARAMAEGIRAKAKTEVGIGVTGIAGPDGGTADKPVGTVAIAVLAGAGARVRTFQFVGAREMVKFQSAQAALNMLRLMLKPQPGAAV